MKKAKLTTVQKSRRKKRVRKRVIGTSDMPRLTVFRSRTQIYAQIVDDYQGATLCEASTRSKDLRGGIKYGGNIEAAKVVGKALAERAKAKGIEKVCFDRNGCKFHGRLKGLADAAREGGLVF